MARSAWRSLIPPSGRNFPKPTRLVGGSRAQFARFVQEEYEKYGRLAKELNIKAE
jgi:hypothetical protein